MKTIAVVVATVSLAAVAPAVGAQDPAAPVQPRTVAAPGHVFVAAARAEQAPSAAATAPAAEPFSPPPNEDFVFDFGAGASPAVRAVFEAAGGIWSDVLEVEVPIEVDVRLQSFGDPGILGGAAPVDLLADHAELPQPGVWYVSALANQFLARDADPDRAEIDVILSADYDFDERLSGPPDPGRVSLLSLALHELGHGLGHTTLAQLLADRSATVRYLGLPLAYDVAVTDGARVPLIDLRPVALGRAITDRLLWRGAEGVQAGGGRPPEIHAPGFFEVGSSVSHLDERTYGLGLMTPYLAPGERHTAVPPLTQAMMADFGWGVEARTAQEMYVTALVRDLTERFPTPTEMRLVAGAISRGEMTLEQAAGAYGRTDAARAAMVDRHHHDVLGRAARPAEAARAVAAMRAGATSASVLADLVSTDAYYAAAGGDDAAWVTALYRDLLGREADAAGRRSWVDLAAASGSRAPVARRFVETAEARGQRVIALYRELLGRDPAPDSLAVWVDALADGHDLDLAWQLATSVEYQARAFRRFG